MCTGWTQYTRARATGAKLEVAKDANACQVHQSTWSNKLSASLGTSRL